MALLNFAFLERLGPDNPLNAVLALQDLAPWWLTEEAVRAARDAGHPAVAEYLPGNTPPRPSSEIGSCWVVCALTEPLPLLRPAVVLPLRWVKGESHSPQLPAKLRQLADSVIADVRASDTKGNAGVGWWLRPAFSDGVALSDDLFSTLASGWATLTGGLLAAVLGLSPSTDVWASVAWRAGHLEPVEGLAAKMETAAAFGAKTFFVHESQVAEVSVPVSLRITATGPKIANGLAESLRNYFAEFSAEPPPPVADSPDEDVQFERCQQYFLKLASFAARSNAYYRTHLLDAIVRRYRRRYEPQAKGIRVRRFVTIVSFSPELIEIVVNAIQPEKVLLLYTKDRKPNGEFDDKQETLARRYQDILETVKLTHGATVECVAQSFVVGNAMTQIADHIAAFAEGVPEEEVLLDLKPGSKKMTYSVIAAAKPGNHMLNMEPEFRDDRRNTPGTEIPELLPAISRHPAPESA